MSVDGVRIVSTDHVALGHCVLLNGSRVVWWGPFEKVRQAGGPFDTIQLNAVDYARLRETARGR
jgi:hypothetical protein